MPIVQMPDGTNVDFGDMPDDKIRSLIATKFPDQVASAAKPEPSYHAGMPLDEAVKIAQSTPAGAAVTGVGQGVTFGLGDEALGVAQGVKNLAAGGDFGTGYTQETNAARDVIHKAQQEHPLAEGLGEVTGGMMVPMGGASVPDNVGRLALQEAGKGAAYGAAYGFGTGEDTNQRLGGAAIGALTGGVVGGAAPLVTGFVTAPINRAVRAARAFANPEQEAARQVATAMNIPDPGRMSPAQFSQAEAFGQPVTNLERGGYPAVELARKASNLSPQAGADLVDAVNSRDAHMSTRTAAFIDNLVGGSQGAQAQVEAVQKQLAPLYRKVYKYGDKTLDSPELARLAQSPEINSAMKNAVKTSKSWDIANGGTGDVTPGNLMFWDHVKQTLDHAAEDAGNKGDAATATRLGMQAEALRNELTNLVPAYANARRQGVEYFGSRDALAAGKKFALGSGNINDAATAISSMSPAEKELFARGFSENLVNTVQKSKDSADITNRIFGSADARNRIKLALGGQRMNELEAFLRGEKAIHGSRFAAKGYSTTAKQIMQALGIGEADNLWESGDPFSLPNIHNIGIGALTKFGSHVAMAKVNSKVGAKVIEMLLSSDPQVYAQGIKAAAKHPGIMRGLRAMTRAGSVGAAQQAVQGVK